MPSAHVYRTTVRWTGNLGTGTRDYRGYSRDHVIEVPGKAPIPGSSGLSARSDPTRHNPEDMMVAALSACHMLWYLHLCSEAGVVVTAYSDEAEGTLELDAGGGGRFTSVTLRPHVVVGEGARELAEQLHRKAHEKCFIANSVNFPVHLDPTIE